MTQQIPLSLTQVQRYCVVHIPDWPTASLGLAVPPDACAVTAHRGRVVHRTLRAQRAGIRSGMRVASAQLLAGELLVLPADESAESARFEAVLRAVETQVAQARMVTPGVAWCFVRGPARWHGSEEAAAEAIIDAISGELGLESTVGIASGTLTALVAAQRGDIVPEGQEASYLSTYSLDAVIDLVPQGRQRYGGLVAQMLLLGIATCADAASCDERAFYARFGQPFRELHALACGGDVFFSDGRRYIDELHASYTCEEPERFVERLMIPLARVAGDMARKLELQGVSAGALVTRVCVESGREYERRWGCVDAGGNDVMVQRLLWHIQGLMSRPSEDDDAPDSGIVSLHLCATDLSEIRSDSPLWGVAKRSHERERAIEHVHSLLGQGGVLQIQQRGAFDPRRRVATRPWGSPLLEVPPVEGAWEGKVSDPPQILCVPPTPVLMFVAAMPLPARSGPDKEEKSPPTGGAQIIPFPRPEHAAPSREAENPSGSSQAEAGEVVPAMKYASHPASIPTNLPARLSVRIPRASEERGADAAEGEALIVDQRGTLNSTTAVLIVQEPPNVDALKQWSVGSRIPVHLYDPVWTVRGRWWDKTPNTGEGARSYVRGHTRDGYELLFVYHNQQWSVEGIYDRPRHNSTQTGTQPRATPEHRQKEDDVS